MIQPQMRFGRNALWMILSRFGAQGLAVVFTILLAGAGSRAHLQGEAHELSELS